jgi:M6 family metalloprotease-like protein
MEVILKKIFAFVLLISLLSGERLAIIRNKTQHIPYEPPSANFTLKLVTETGEIITMPVHKFQPVKMFRNFKIPKPKLTEQPFNVLVLRVEFVEDDDPLTTGNGKMDLNGFNEPDSGLYYDPPHDKTYFERQMQFLTNYYKSNSFGNLVCSCTVKPDELTKSYQLPHKMAFYSGFHHYDSSTGFVYYNTYAMEMGLVRLLTDAVAAADLDGTIDFSNYDAMIIFHAGCLLQTGLNFFRFRDLPSANIPPGALEYYLGVPYIIANNGTDTINYMIAINSEMARVDSYMVSNLGTVCHEFGHIVGLPDLYDVTGWSNGVGAWDLMCTGGWVGSPVEGAPEGTIPANLSAWSRYDLGWVTPQLVTNPETLLTIRASEIDTTQYGVADQTMIKIPVSGTEFFLIENRQQDIVEKDTIWVDVEDGVPISVDHGEYDFFLPGSGVLIWHIDNNVLQVWYDYGYNVIQVNPNHKGVDLEEADGIQHFDAWWYGDSLEYSGSRYDPFFRDDSNKANHEFGPFTNPNSDSYYGKSLLNIDVKSKLDTLMDISVDFDIYQTGFPVPVRPNYPIYSVSYGDLDNNGDLEVIAAIRGGSVYAFNHDGTAYGNYLNNDTITSFLAVGDVNGDHAEDIAFATGFDLVCLDGLTLAPLSSFPFTAEDNIFGAPLLFDIDGDSNNEIIFGSKDYHLYCLDATGTNIANFPIYLNTWILSTPCVFKKDKRMIGILGSDGRFWLVDKDGIVKEFTDSKHNMLTYASPVVGDIDRDGEPEAVTVNGYGTIYIYGEDSLEQWFDILIDTTYYITPGLADIDKDGYLEIIMPNGSKTLFVTNRNGISENNFPMYTDGNIFYPLLAADLDSLGKTELIFGLEKSDTLIYGYNFSDTISIKGQLKVINNRKREFAFSPLFGEGGFSSPGVIFDIDDDGDIELACGSDYGKLYIWDFPGTEVSWSGYMNSPKNWGYFQGELVQPQVASGLLGSFYIYPSPVENKGKVRFFLNRDAEVTVEIMDIVGHTIGSAQPTNNVTANEYNEVTFDFTRQSNGIYLVRIEAKNGNEREVKFKKFAVLK